MTQKPKNPSGKFNCIIGTRAQLIKMAPLLLQLERQNFEYRLILTGQHTTTIQELLHEFRVTTQPEYIYNGPEVSGLTQVIPWFIQCFCHLFKHKSDWFSIKGTPLLVHGDTFSTLLGAIIGKLTKQTVVHVESGLRSFNWLNPFPEELTRCLVFQLTNIACCPDEWSLSNIKNKRITKVNTNGNTLIDSLRIALTSTKKTAPPFEQPYGIVSIHRFENIFNKPRLETITKLIEIAAEHAPLIFVLHPATKKNLERHNLVHQLEANKNIKLVPRMTYLRFINLLGQSSFAITDGGSNQEELSYLGIPTYLMRNATERKEGLDSNVTIGGYQSGELTNFLASLGTLARAPNIPDTSPSKIIIKAILDNGN